MRGDHRLTGGQAAGWLALVIGVVGWLGTSGGWSAGAWAAQQQIGHAHALVVNSTIDSLLMGTHHGLFESRDEGRTWTPIPIAGGITGRDFMTIAVHPEDPKTLYAGGHDLGVVKSTDGGRTWADSRHGLGGMDVHALTIDPTDPRKLYAWVIDQGLYRSTDGGNRWHRVNDGPPNPDVRALASVPIPTGMGGIYLYAGTSDGLFRDADCF